MSSGFRIRSWKKTSRLFPETTSTTRPKHVDRYAVMKLRSRLVHQRKLRQFGDEFLERAVAVKQPALAVHLVDWRVPKAPYVNPAVCRIRSRIGDFPLGGHGFVLRADKDPEALQFGNVFRDGIVKLEFALFPEDHCGDGRDGFRHRVDAEDRVGLSSGWLFRQVHHSEGRLQPTFPWRATSVTAPANSFVVPFPRRDVGQLEPFHGNSHLSGEACGNSPAATASDTVNEQRTTAQREVASIFMNGLSLFRVRLKSSLSTLSIASPNVDEH